MVLTFFMFALGASYYSFSYLPLLEVLGCETYESIRNSHFLTSTSVKIVAVNLNSSIINSERQLMPQMHKEAFSSAH